jgi:rod shape-determining protein MreC
VAKAIETRKGRLLLAALVVAHLMIISHQVDAGGGSSLLERTVFGLLSPFQRAVARVVDLFATSWSGYVSLRGVKQDNAALEAELRTLELQLSNERERGAEAGRLRELLGLRQALPFETVAAEVLAREGLPWFRSVTLGKGQRDGVALNAPVISSSGVVGRVVSLGPHAAKVQLLLDRDAGVGVVIERSRASGVVSGQVGLADSGSPDLIMKYVPALADVQPGDRVLTSGLDRIFPKGLVVGRVLSVAAASGLFREVVVAPSARFDQLETVLVVRRSPEDLALTESVR